MFMSEEVIKSALISDLASIWTNYPEDVIAVGTNLILDSITAELAHGGRVEIRGFGSFSLHHCPPRKAHNPKSGEKVDVPDKYKPHFKPGKELKELVNKSRTE
jgi:integration host factor subunit beta